MTEVLGALYHWSPRARRAAIREHGLVAGSPVTVCTSPMKAVCFAADPAVGWALSGGTEWVEATTWDLWMVRLDDTDSVEITPQWGARISEVRVRGDIPAGRLWWVGERAG